MRKNNPFWLRHCLTSNQLIARWKYYILKHVYVKGYALYGSTLIIPHLASFRHI